jgi:hypothetical protein
MLSEADLIAKRAALQWLVQQHPQWTHQDLADALSMSRSWVSKWLQRLYQADPDDIMALHSRSRARHTPPTSIASQFAVVQRILEIRLAPPENLQRVPGPETILYYVHRDPALKQAGVRLPRSQTTIWKILRQAGCIEQDHRRKPKPFELRQPGEEVQFDLKDASSVQASAEGKRQHVVEIANFVDAGTSIWLHREVRSDFTAEVILEVVAQFLCEHGLPQMLTFDNDPRFVGSPAGRDFPSALVRFLLCLGVQPNVIPPHRPDLNASVERDHSLAWSGVLTGPSARHALAGCLRSLRHFWLIPTRSVPIRHAPAATNRLVWLVQPFRLCLLFPRLSIPIEGRVQVDKRAFARTIRARGDLTINCQNY